MAGPPGFLYRPQFISIDEERELLQHISALPLEQARYKEYTARRRVASLEGDGPQFLRSLKSRVAAWVEVRASELSHALVAEYRPGTPLGWHRDMPQYGLVCGVSLAGEHSIPAADALRYSITFRTPAP